MPELTSMADKIIQYRHERKLSQFEFACDCGISTDNLGMIERVTGNPTLDTMQKIAAYMDITVSDLLDPTKPLPQRDSKEVQK